MASCVFTLSRFAVTMLTVPVFLCYCWIKAQAVQALTKSEAQNYFDNRAGYVVRPDAAMALKTYVKSWSEGIRDFDPNAVYLNSEQAKQRYEVLPDHTRHVYLQFLYGSPDWRKRYIERLVRVERLSNDYPVPALRGQFGVFANRNIQRGTVIGAYAGTILFHSRNVAGYLAITSDLQAELSDLKQNDSLVTVNDVRRYTMRLTPQSEKHCCTVSGFRRSNAMSMINSYWAPPQTPADNLDKKNAAVLGAHMGTHVPVSLIIATQFIPINTEILIDYGSSYWNRPPDETFLVQQRPFVLSKFSKPAGCAKCCFVQMFPPHAQMLAEQTMQLLLHGVSEQEIFVLLHANGYKLALRSSVLQRGNLACPAGRSLFSIYAGRTAVDNSRSRCCSMKDCPERFKSQVSTSINALPLLSSDDLRVRPNAITALRNDEQEFLPKPAHKDELHIFDYFSKRYAPIGTVRLPADAARSWTVAYRRFFSKRPSPVNKLAEARLIDDGDARAALRGQRGVFAKTEIPALTVVGFYAGVILKHGQSIDDVDESADVHAELLRLRYVDMDATYGDLFSFALPLPQMKAYGNGTLMVSSIGRPSTMSFINSYWAPPQTNRDNASALNTGIACLRAKDQVPVIAFYSTRKISKNEELLMDYGQAHWGPAPVYQRSLQYVLRHLDIRNRFTRSVKGGHQSDFWRLVTHGPRSVDFATRKLQEQGLERHACFHEGSATVELADASLLETKGRCPAVAIFLSSIKLRICSHSQDQ